MKKALSSTEILAKKFETFDFSPAWKDAFDEPETNGIWLAYGDSGNGKTAFIMELAKELSRFGGVLINSLEEGLRKTIQDAWIRHRMSEHRKVQLLNKEPMPILQERLKKQKSKKFIIIDSIQYTKMTFPQILDMKDRFSDRLFVFISQKDKNKPSGQTAEKVMYDADLKILIEGFRAISKGRYIGKLGYYTIWEDGAKMYWEDQTNNEQKTEHE